MSARKKPDHEKIKHVVQVLLTRRDEARLRKHALAKGVAVSAFVRGLIVEAIAQ